MAFLLGAWSGQVLAETIMIVAVGVGGDLTTLYQMDPVTGKIVRRIGSVGYAINDLAWDRKTNKLFGSTSFKDPSGYHGLVQIDLATGQGSNESFIDGWGFDKATFDNADYPNVGLTANASGDLYGLEDYGPPGEEGLNKVDKYTGIVTEIGNAFAVSRDGLAFDLEDRLYFIDSGRVSTIDVNTGVRTLVAEYEVPTIVNGEFNPLNGLYYGAEVRSNRIGVMDVRNGEFSFLTTDIFRIHAVVFVEVGERARVDLAGVVTTSNDVGVCAMVLASGQYQFSCNPYGPYSLKNLPREMDGTVRRQVYAHGFFPRVDVLPGTTYETVIMEPARDCPNYNLPYNPDTYPDSAGKRQSISGRVLLQSTDIPICAMVLANGAHMFSCDGLGNYSLEFPLDNKGQFNLQVYADGFAPSVQIYDEFSLGGDVRMASSTECD